MTWTREPPSVAAVRIDKKPDRRTLLKVVSELQNLLGDAMTYHGNDRDTQGFELGQQTLMKAFDLCVRARSFDPPDDVYP